MYTHTLLLVDDSVTTQQEIRSAFAGQSIQVVVAEDGHRGLDRIEADRPAVVLASTTAPGVDGYGLACYVSQRPYLRNVAVLLLTGAVEPTDDQRIKESGARGFVRNPIEPSVVVARVKAALMSPEPEPEPGPVDEFGQITTAAFDAIDASMTGRVVGERANPRASAMGVPLSPPRPNLLLRLQSDMGLNDIEFEEVLPPPAEPVVYTDLSARMGVADFAFDDAPPRAAERAVAADPSVEAVHAPPQEETRPAPEPPPAPDAPSEPMTPEEAAKTVFFTFDPMPPVPPRLPREPGKD